MRVALALGGSPAGLDTAAAEVASGKGSDQSVEVRGESLVGQTDWASCLACCLVSGADGHAGSCLADYEAVGEIHQHPVAVAVAGSKGLTNALDCSAPKMSDSSWS